jgi:hypothetical protein
MSQFLALHRLAIERSEGLHPKLLAAFREQASGLDEPLPVPLLTVRDLKSTVLTGGNPDFGQGAK